MNIIIRNGQIVAGNPPQLRTGDLLISDNVISEIGNVPSRSNARVIDAANKVVLPGLIDPHTHFIEGPSDSGYYMLTRAGVTTALDTIICECGFTLECMHATPMGLNMGFMGLLKPGLTVSSEEPSEAELSSVMNEFIEKGAWGIKLAGAHYPLTPEGTRRAIAVAARNNIPFMLHAGSTVNRDDFAGFKEALLCSEHNPMILAHINCYCRGAEAEEALELLQKYPEVVSESNFSDTSCLGCRIVNGRPDSLCVCDTLTDRGYEATYPGLLAAIKDGAISVLVQVGHELQLSTPEIGYEHCVAMQGKVSIAYNANRTKENHLLAAGRNSAGEFVIDAFSSDGGVLPRNITLSAGAELIKNGLWNWSDFVFKASIAGSRMLGLQEHKGALQSGYDADVVIADPESGNVETVIINGQIIYNHGEFYPQENRMFALRSGHFGNFTARETQVRWLQECGFIRNQQ